MDSWASERLTKLTNGPNHDSSAPTRTCSSKNTKTFINPQPSHPPIKFFQNSTTRMDTNSSSENNLQRTSNFVTSDPSKSSCRIANYQKRQPRTQTKARITENDADRKRHNYLYPNCLEDTSPCLRADIHDSRWHRQCTNLRMFINQITYLLPRCCHIFWPLLLWFTIWSYTLL